MLSYRVGTRAQRTLGSDIAGRVAAVGPDVVEFRVGDDVYGDNLWLKGGFAEFAVAPVKALAHKPEALDFVEASTLPKAGAIATQGTARVRSEDRVLIIGAGGGGGGGSGSFAIELAAQVGAHVTGVDNGGKLEFMRSLGADTVVDHRREDVTRLGPLDHVLDLVGHRSIRACRRALAPGGRYDCVGGSVAAPLRFATVGPVIGCLSGRHIGVLAVDEGPEHFEPLALRCAEGEVQIHVDRIVGLDDVPDAVGEGRALGRVVVVPR